MERNNLSNFGRGSPKEHVIYAIFNDKSFNNALTKDIVSFDNWAL